MSSRYSGSQSTNSYTRMHSRHATPLHPDVIHYIIYCAAGRYGGVQAHSQFSDHAALAGCDVVLCGGHGLAGGGALKAGGICAVPVSLRFQPRSWFAAYAAGSLSHLTAAFALQSLAADLGFLALFIC